MKLEKDKCRNVVSKMTFRLPKDEKWIGLILILINSILLNKQNYYVYNCYNLKHFNPGCETIGLLLK